MTDMQPTAKDKTINVLVLRFKTWNKQVEHRESAI